MPRGELFTGRVTEQGRLRALRRFLDFLQSRHSSLRQTAAEFFAWWESVGPASLRDPAVSDLLDEADGQNDLDSWQRANIAEMRREVAHATALPADLGNAKLTAVREGNCIGLLPQPTGLIVAWARKILRSVFGLFSSNRKG